MQIAAMSPKYISRNDVAEDLYCHEKENYKGSNKE